MGEATVFVSYCRADRAWLDEFVMFMSSFDLDLWDDTRIEAGASWPQEIEQALDRASAAVLLVSQRFLASRFIREVELPTLLSRLQRSGRLFWIYIGHAHWEQTALAAIQGMHELGVPLEDLPANKRNGALKEITAKIHALCRPTPALVPGWGRTPRAPAESLPAPPSLRLLSLPRRPHQCFTGRENILALLHAELSRAAARAPQVLSGLSGTGKTEIALQYVQRFGLSFSGVAWLRADDPVTLARDYVALAPHVGLRLVDGQDDVTAVAAVCTALGKQERYLLVFDDAHDISLIERYLPFGTGVHVLITTSFSHWPMANVIAVDALTRAEAAAFLRSRTQQSDGAAEVDIAERLGRLPLALEQAAAYIETRAKTLAAYAQLLDKHGLLALERVSTDSGHQTIGTIWRLALEQLQGRSGAIELLKLCALLSPDKIHLPDLARSADLLEEPLLSARDDHPLARVARRVRELLLDELARDDAKAGLLSYSMVRAEADGDTITVHRLMQEVVRDGMAREERQAFLAYARRLVARALPKHCEDERFWKESSRWIPHASTLLTLGAATAECADSYLALCDGVGAYFMGRGAYTDAERYYRLGLETAERLLAATDPRIGQLANGLGFALKALERLLEAEHCYERALAVLDPGGPPESTSEVLNNLGVLLAVTNRRDDAAARYRRGLEILREAGEESSTSTARILGNMANLAYERGNLQEAEASCRRTLEVEELASGPASSRVSIHLNNLAMIVKGQRRFDESEQLLRKALTLDEQLLGPDHPNVGIRLYNLSQILDETGRAPDALALVRRATSIFDRTLPRDHSRSLKAHEALARLLATHPE